MSVKWTAPTNVSSPVSGVTVNADAGSLGTEYDNETNKHRHAALELSFQHAVAPAGSWFVYLVYAIDGTSYEDGDASTQPANPPAAVFAPRAVTTAQVVSCRVPLLPFKFKALVWNDTDQDSSASAVTLDLEVFNEDPEA